MLKITHRNHNTSYDTDKFQPKTPRCEQIEYRYWSIMGRQLFALHSVPRLAQLHVIANAGGKINIFSTNSCFQLPCSHSLLSFPFSHRKPTRLSTTAEQTKLSSSGDFHRRVDEDRDLGGPWSQRSEAQEAKLRPILLHDEDRVEGLLCCRVSCCGGNTYIWSSWFVPDAQNRMNNSWGWRGQKMVEAIEAKERGHWGWWMTGREDRRGGTSYWCFVVWREPVLLIPIDQILWTSVLATIFLSSRDYK